MRGCHLGSKSVKLLPSEIFYNVAFKTEVGRTYPIRNIRVPISKEQQNIGWTTDDELQCVLIVKAGLIMYISLPKYFCSLLILHSPSPLLCDVFTTSLFPRSKPVDIFNCTPQTTKEFAYGLLDLLNGKTVNTISIKNQCPGDQFKAHPASLMITA